VGTFDTINAIKHWESNEYRAQVYTRDDGRPLGSLVSHYLWRSGSGISLVIPKSSKRICKISPTNERAVVGLRPGKCQIVLRITVTKRDSEKSRKLCIDSTRDCGWFITSGQQMTAKLKVNFIN
jgi:hypothetical protein